ncbi:MAG: hypothetical protein JWN14_370, partial [Chthonomonadales bacterium]|nr:hypothetical protein [Chthonomonadales bacterium]
MMAISPTTPKTVAGWVSARTAGRSLGLLSALLLLPLQAV